MGETLTEKLKHPYKFKPSELCEYSRGIERIRELRLSSIESEHRSDPEKVKELTEKVYAQYNPLLNILSSEINRREKDKSNRIENLEHKMRELKQELDKYLPRLKYLKEHDIIK